MRLTFLPTDQLSMADLAGPPREHGLHLSDILRVLKAEREPAKFRNEEGEWEPKDIWRLEVGFLWEEVLGRAMSSRRKGIVRPDPITKDGVICSPDGWIPATKTLIEDKSTAASSKRELLDFRWYWMYQIKAYAYVLGAEPPALLRVLYLNGDYSRSDRPCHQEGCEYPGGVCHPHVFQVSWYEGELEETWAELLGIAREHGLLPKTRVKTRKAQ